jgi:yeast amino acid transporter
MFVNGLPVFHLANRWSASQHPMFLALHLRSISGVVIWVDSWVSWLASFKLQYQQQVRSYPDVHNQSLRHILIPMTGPDYVSMAAGEARSPRKSLPKAYYGVLYRLLAFFILGSLCVGIIIPYSDSELVAAVSQARPGAGSSPYVIAMQRLRIRVLPHIVNALILSSVYSAGNSYVYTSSRTLLGLALEGKAPIFLTHCTSKGVPIYCVGVVLLVGLLGESGFSLCFLNVRLQKHFYRCPTIVRLFYDGIFSRKTYTFHSMITDLTRFINLVTASQLLNYSIISFTYLRFNKVVLLALRSDIN